VRYCAAVPCPAIQTPWVIHSNTVQGPACVPKSHYKDDSGDWQASDCHVKCEVGYTGGSTQEEHFQCTASGSWSGSLDCPAVSCPANSWWSQSGSGSWVPGLPGHWDSPSDFPAAAGPSSVPSDCSSTPHKALDAICALTCNAGYNANGNTDTYTCVANGREQTGMWQGTADLVCAPVSCDQVSDPVGGTVTVELQDGSPGAKSSPYFSGVADPSTSNGGTTATYTCNDGFVLDPVEGALTGNNPTDTPVDQRVLYCNTAGKWADDSGTVQNHPPTCFEMCSESQQPCAQGSDPAGDAEGTCIPVSTEDDSTIYKYTCSCDLGWQQTSRSSASLWIDRGQTCEDIDECGTTNGGCKRSRCVNTQGSFYCDECNSGSSCCAGGQGRTGSRGDHSGFAAANHGNPDQRQAIDTCCDATSGDCTEGVGGYCSRITSPSSEANDWLPDADQQCIGPPVASDSVLALGELCVDDSGCQRTNLADGGDWDGSWRPSDCDKTACSASGATSTREAGAPILITVVAKDSHSLKNAELTGVCTSTDFGATVQEPFGSAGPFSFQSSNYDKQLGLGPFYLSLFTATVASSYSVAVSVKDDPMTTSPFTIQVVAAPGDAGNSNMHGTECDTTAACNCLAGSDPTCTVLPSDSLQFTVTVRDKYSNVRDAETGTWTLSDSVTLHTTAHDGNSNDVNDMVGQWQQSSCPANDASSCWTISFDASRADGNYTVALVWSNDTCHTSTPLDQGYSPGSCGSSASKFQLTVHQPDAADIGRQLYRTMSVDAPLQQIEAGFTETLTLHVQDDDDACLCGSDESSSCSAQYVQGSLSCYKHFLYDRVRIHVEAQNPSADERNRDQQFVGRNLPDLFPHSPKYDQSTDGHPVVELRFRMARRDEPEICDDMHDTTCTNEDEQPCPWTGNSITRNGTYHVSFVVVPVDNDCTQPTSLMNYMGLNAFYAIEVIPAALHVPSTVVDIPKQHRQIVARAGHDSVWHFQARDKYKNIRLNNDTLKAKMTQHISNPQPLWDPHESLPPVDVNLTQSWDPQAGRYDVIFNSKLCMQWDDRNPLYNVTVKLGSGPGRHVPGSVFHVRVTPDDLSPQESGPGPLVLQIEAGRPSTFGVVPRDQWGNVRDIELFDDLTDTLRVELQGVTPADRPQPINVCKDCADPGYRYPKLQFCDPASCQSSCDPASCTSARRVATYTRSEPHRGASENTTELSLVWQAEGDSSLGIDPPLRRHETHYSVTYMVTAKGQYSIKVSLTQDVPAEDDSFHPIGSAATQNTCRYGDATPSASEGRDDFVRCNLGASVTCPLGPYCHLESEPLYYVEALHQGLGDQNGRFAIEVIPAALHVDNTLNYTYAIAADREQDLPVAYAGVNETWQFITRDVYGNVRINNDTIIPAIAPATKQHRHQDLQKVINAAWNPAGCYDVVFNVQQSVQWNDPNDMYDVRIRIGQQCKGVIDHNACTATTAVEFGPGDGVDERGRSFFRVLVRPSELNPAQSRRHSGPGFAETEAGRLSSFGVAPRDQYGNLRDIVRFGLSDSVTVTLQGYVQQSPPTSPQQIDPDWQHRDRATRNLLQSYPAVNPEDASQYPPLQYTGGERHQVSLTYGLESGDRDHHGNTSALQIAWESNGTQSVGKHCTWRGQCTDRVWDSPQNHMEAHFNASFVLYGKGTYNISVFLQDRSARNAQHAVNSFALLTHQSANVFVVRVIPAALHVNYTVNYTYAIADDREGELPVAYAGRNSTWKFIARDKFGNIRIDNDTMALTFEQLGLDDSKNDAGQKHNLTKEISYSWNDQCQCYEVVFRTEQSMQWDDYNVHYAVGVKLGQRCEVQPGATTAGPCESATGSNCEIGLPCRQPSNDDLQGFENVPGSRFTVMIRPAKLAPAKKSGPGPEYDETEAGRPSRFGVVPRDKFGNVLAIEQFRLSDKLRVIVDGPIGYDKEPTKTVLSGCEPFCKRATCNPLHPVAMVLPNPQSPCASHYVSTYQGFDKNGFESAPVSSCTGDECPPKSYAGCNNRARTQDKAVNCIYKNHAWPRCASYVYDNLTNVQCVESSWVKDGSQGWGVDENTPHHEKHFQTNFVLTISGVYTFSVELGDIFGYNSEQWPLMPTTVELAHIDDSPFWITVIPAQLDTRNSRTLSYFGMEEPRSLPNKPDNRPEQVKGKYVAMSLQTRDRYDNVRCLQQANDTLTITVKMKHTNDDDILHGTVVCNPINNVTSHETGKKWYGKTICDENNGNSTVNWMWTNHSEECQPKWGPTQRSTDVENHGGCFRIEFNSYLTTGFDFLVHVAASTPGQGSAEVNEISGKYPQDKSPWFITYRTDFDNATNSSNFEQWHFVGPGRASDSAGTELVTPSKVSIEYEASRTSMVEKYEGNEYNSYLKGDLGLLGMCKADDLGHPGAPQPCSEIFPVLTMPNETNILKVVVTDQEKSIGHHRGNILDYAVDVTVSFTLDPACTMCSSSAINLIDHTITRVDRCPGTITDLKECEPGTGGMDRACCVPLYYLIEFQFDAAQEFAYNVNIIVSNGTAEHALPPIRYLYAVHPLSPDSAHVGSIYPPFTSSDKVPQPSWWSQPTTSTLFPSICERLQCADYYATTQIEGWPQVAKGAVYTSLTYQQWKVQCRNAGCLFHSGTSDANKNTVKFAVEHGHLQRPEQSRAIPISQPSDIQLSLSVTENMCTNAPNLDGRYQWGWTPSGNESGMSTITDSLTEVDNSDPQDGRQGAFENYVWRHTNAPVNGQYQMCGPKTFQQYSGNSVKCPHSWKTAECAASQRVWWRPCAPNVTSLQFEPQWQAHGEPIVAQGQVDPGLVDSSNQRTIYTTMFSAPNAGSYNLTVHIQLKDGAAWRQATALPARVDIGPGVLDITKSILLEPTFVGRVNTENPASGPDEPMSVEYNYTVAVRDEKNQPRYGTDQMFARISRVEDLEVLGPSKSAQIYGSKNDKIVHPPICFATDRLKRHLTSLPSAEQIARGYPKDLSDCEWHTINIGNPCSHRTAGVYTFIFKFKYRGVFRMELWQCGLDSLHNCHQNSEQQYVGMWGTRNARAILPLNPSGSDNHGMIFTVCALNSFTTKGHWQDPDLGFVQGSWLHTCLCRPGYYGQRGQSCQPCGKGTFSKDAGLQVCQQCQAGRSCSCANTGSGKCSKAGEPACDTCPACPDGFYQDERGRESCKLCPAGFTCSLGDDASGLPAAMTWPVAQEGKYVSAADPTEVHTCTLGARKPAGTTQDDEDAPRGMACPGGDPQLASKLKCVISDSTHEMEASANPQRSEDCRKAIGALCEIGYAGTGMAACSRCCKVDDSYLTGNCPKPASNWYLQSADNQCQRCPQDDTSTLIIMTIIGAAILGPFLFKIAEVMKHAGQLQGPVMSLVNFFQCADLFKSLDLHWPPKFLKYIRMFASLFNFRLPDLPFVVHPECAFTLSYFQKWTLEMASPFIVYGLLFLLVTIRYTLSYLLWDREAAKKLGGWSTLVTLVIMFIHAVFAPRSLSTRHYTFQAALPFVCCGVYCCFCWCCGVQKMRRTEHGQLGEILQLGDDNTVQVVRQLNGHTSDRITCSDALKQLKYEGLLSLFRKRWQLAALRRNSGAVFGSVTMSFVVFVVLYYSWSLGPEMILFAGVGAVLSGICTYYLIMSCTERCFPKRPNDKYRFPDEPSSEAWTAPLIESARAATTRNDRGSAGLTSMQEALHRSQDRTGLRSSFLLNKNLSTPEPVQQPHRTNGCKVYCDPCKHPRIHTRERDLLTFRGESLDELYKSISMEFGIQVRVIVSCFVVVPLTILISDLLLSSQIETFTLEHSGDNTGYQYVPLTNLDQLSKKVDAMITAEGATFWNELRIVEPRAEPEPLPEPEMEVEQEPMNFDIDVDTDQRTPNFRLSTSFAATISKISDMQDKGRRCCCSPDSFVQVVLYLLADRILQFDSVAYRKALDRIWSTNLVFLMVGYVFLVPPP
jgi:hypothetical protein